MKFVNFSTIKKSTATKNGKQHPLLMATKCMHNFQWLVLEAAALPVLVSALPRQLSASVSNQVPQLSSVSLFLARPWLGLKVSVSALLVSYISGICSAFGRDRLGTVLSETVMTSEQLGHWGQPERSHLEAATYTCFRLTTLALTPTDIHHRHRNHGGMLKNTATDRVANSCHHNNTSKMLDIISKYAGLTVSFSCWRCWIRLSFSESSSCCCWIRSRLTNSRSFKCRVSRKPPSIIERKTCNWKNSVSLQIFIFH